MGKKKINWLQFLCTLVLGIIGCVWATLIYWNLSAPLYIKSGLSLAVIAFAVFLGAFISELISSRNLGYANRSVVCTCLLLGVLFIFILTTIFQAILGSSALKSIGSLYLVVDRSSSMDFPQTDSSQNNTERAGYFLDSLADRLPVGQEIELYQYGNNAIQKDENIRTVP